MKINSPQRNKAFTLVETLVAISIFTVSLLGMMSVLGSSIANTNYAKQKITAEYLAQEGIEYARNIRDNYVLYPGHTWAEFRDIPAPFSVINPPLPSDSSFTRTVTKNPVNNDEVQIISKVEWKQGSGNYNITFSENLFNWVE